MDQRTRIVGAVLGGLKLPPRFRLKLVKDDPVRLELSITPAYGKEPILVGIVESQDLVARRDREGRVGGHRRALVVDGDLARGQRRGRGGAAHGRRGDRRLRSA